MTNFLTIMIHNKGRWLFVNEKHTAPVREEITVGCDVEDLANRFLADTCRAKKWDLAFVGAVAVEEELHQLYLADISAFIESCPDFLIPLSADRRSELCEGDRLLFERTMDFIADCRRATAALLGKEVNIIMDRPVGTRHPKHPEIVYPINYWYIDGMLSADGEGIDVYLLGIHKPLESFRAKIIAVVRREDDIEDKLAAAPVGMDFSEEEIAREIRFQEQFYRSTVHKSV